VFIPKWRGYALQLLFADFILNLLCFGMTEFKSISTYPPKPANPLLPAHDLYIYQAGFMVSIGTGYAVYAVVMGFTGLGVLDFVIGMCSGKKDYKPTVMGAVLVFWIFLTCFIVALPILAILEMIVKIVNFFRKKPKYECEPSLQRTYTAATNHWTSMLSQPLRQIFGHDVEDDWVDPNWFTWKICLVYLVLLAASIVSAVGNWMTTIMLYGMAGEAWCPANLDYFTALQVCLPLVGHLLDAGFMAIS
jgi:hypothetical protein